MNPFSKYIDNYLNRKVELKLSAGKEPPISKTPDMDDMSKAVVLDYFRTYQSLYRKELDDWQVAREARHHPVNPTTWRLQQLYKDALIDIFLRRQVFNRTLRITNKVCQIKDKDGNLDIEATKTIQTKWFRSILKQAIYSKMFGYSLIYINDWKPGNINTVVSMPRELIIPERGIIMRQYTDLDGLKYGDYPNFLVYIQLEEDAIGLMEAIAPLTILKRHSWASWDEFEQIFGMPLRIAKTMVQTEKHLNELESWLQMMGTAAYAILPKTDEIEIKPNEQTDSYNVFNEKRRAVNEEIAVGINGQTMTTLQGSSRSQGEVHLKTQEEITNEDIQDIRDWFNVSFINVMRALGYNFPDGHTLDIISNTVVPVEEKVKIDESISRMGFNFDPEYIEQTYNVTLDKENPIKQVANTPNFQDPTQLGFF